VIGTLLSGRFRLEERIGSGGMSTVYRALDETLERWVAIKLLHGDISRDPDQLERFRREARVVARLSHPHVVTVIDAGEDEGKPYIVFEYVAGETLKDRIRREGRLPISEAVAYAIEIGRALIAAHAERLVHRDVKPQNVLLDTEGRAKVTDFGIARSLEAEGLTLPGRVLGTCDYVAPEQALGEPVTAQSDLYSLGVCLYEMLTGEVPFTADTQVGVAMRHVREPLPDVREKRPEVSAALAAVVERTCSKERANRHPDARSLVADLEQVLAIEAARTGQAPGEATTVLRELSGDTADFVPLRVRNPRRMVALVALVAVLSAGILAAVVLRTEQGQSGIGATPREPESRPPGSELVSLSAGAAQDYDPEVAGEAENPGQVGNVLDGQVATFWETEGYDSAEFGNLKDGVGIYLDAERRIQAERLDLVTPTPGWNAEVYAANAPVPDGLEGWTRVGGTDEVQDEDRVLLDGGGRAYRYWLLWVTRLPQPPPDGRARAQIAELTLIERREPEAG